MGLAVLHRDSQAPVLDEYIFEQTTFLHETSKERIPVDFAE